MRKKAINNENNHSANNDTAKTSSLLNTDLNTNANKENDDGKSIFRSALRSGKIIQKPVLIPAKEVKAQTGATAPVKEKSSNFSSASLKDENGASPSFAAVV